MDAGAAAWANSASFKQLRRLRLANCHLTDDALAAIFRSPQLQALEELDLAHNGFTAAGISQAVVGSPRWQTLKQLGLSNCRLDNAAIAALTQVEQAPALRSLALGYNSIGPQGAAALANWSVLANVWQLDLHDNLIGDDGLIALAGSPNVSRLLEIDLEQDCRNSRRFDFNDRAAAVLGDSKSLPRLDGMFSGCVDEYHSAAYSPGFSKDGLNAVRKSVWMRPACKAACSDFSEIEDYLAQPDFDEQAPLDDHDFRRAPYQLIEYAEDERPAERLSPSATSSGKSHFDFERPPKISEPPAEADFDDKDIIEGLEFRDPTLLTDSQLTLDLSLVDSERPLPVQVGKYLSDTLASAFAACHLGNFEMGGSEAREDDAGRIIETDMDFSVGLQGDPQPAIQLIREVLWWIGAPEATGLYEAEANAELPLALSAEPETTSTRFLQLAAPQVTRWKGFDEPGHRIDRAPFSKTQRQTIQSILRDANAVETGGGWVDVKTQDEGLVAICVKYLEDSPDFNSLNMLVTSLTPQISGLVHRLMQECALMLFPMAFAASDEVAWTLDCDWPSVTVVETADSLHELLARGPYHWWRSAG